MKKIAFVFLILSFSICTNASTSITTSNVSGRWNLAGSPYLIYNDIYLNSSDTLIIDPGVEIIFQGYYLFQVYGLLTANGTLELPINFHVQDTTGHYDSSTAGGWQGITIGYLYDYSTLHYSFSYCNISDLKGCFVDYRSMTVNNCNFFNNGNFYDIGSTVANVIFLDSSYHVEFESCNFYNNKSRIGIFGIGNDNNVPTHVNISDCNFYNNIVAYYYGVRGKIVEIGGNILFKNNSIYNNFGGALTISNSIGTVINNRIYNNVSSRTAGISCWSSALDIVANYICNNQMTDTSECGEDVDAGGIDLNSDDLTTCYYVRNNIIANNYSSWIGGGIGVKRTNAVIYNNQIINNKSIEAAGIGLLGFGVNIIIKNNIFYGNVSLPYFTSLNSPVLGGSLDSSRIEFENNWTEHSCTFDFYWLLGGFDVTLVGDTISNIMGTNPGLIAPTLTADVSESALLADFRLLPSSICINKGDTASIKTDLYDFCGNNRIVGSIIDIGAYEYYGSDSYPTSLAYRKGNKYEILYYPNPATDFFIITVPTAQGILDLIDVTGKIVLETKIVNTNTVIDIHNLSKGVYQEIWILGNERKEVERLVVE